MWQSSNHRNWAKQQARKKAKERHRTPLHMLRVPVELKITMGLGKPPIILKGRALLNEFNPKGIHVFTHQKLEPGQDIALTLEEPRRIYVRAKIMGSQLVQGETKVVSEHHYPYRVALLFSYTSDEERKEVQAFCNELQQKHLFGMLALAVA